MCGMRITLGTLIRGGQLSPIGMMVDPDDARFSVSCFTHDAPGCGTSFIVPVEAFAEFILGADSTAGPSDGASCERHSGKISDLAACQEECAHAPFRRFLVQVLLPRARRARQARLTSV